MIPPVISTATPPMTSGSAAAANEPKTASRITKMIGKPTRSALARSSLVRSTIPAQSAPWPIRCTLTSP